MFTKPNGTDGAEPPNPETKPIRSDFTVHTLTRCIPADLMKRDQWVLWRRERGTKVPYGINQRKASTINPYDWSSYAAVIDCFESRLKQFAGIGFVFHESDPFVGIDLDDCLEDTTGDPKPCVQPMLERFSDTYVEISPSGLGLKIWCLGKLPAAFMTRLKDGCALEMYDRARYFAVTGNVFGKTPLKIGDHAEDVIALFDQLAGRASRDYQTSDGKIPHGQQHLTLVSLAGTLRRRGVCDQAIEACLQAVNRYHCERPGSERNISRIVRSTRTWGRI
jgi:primase-polymerase (primpol)-like protein